MPYSSANIVVVDADWFLDSNFEERKKSDAQFSSQKKISILFRQGVKQQGLLSLLHFGWKIGVN